MSEEYSPERLTKVLSRLPRATRCWIAYSGGLDSHVLLHSMATLRKRLAGVQLLAVHVNHGLHGDSGQWASHCASVCRELDVCCHQLEVDARSGRGESPEATARRARYEAIGNIMNAGDMVLTAHHRDDQAETLLLHLLRGSGPHGLAAMSLCRGFGKGWLARPLLDFSRAALREYAESKSLRWVDDPSNREDRFERNYVRHEVMPALKMRWPALTSVLARAASHQAEAARLLDDVADKDLEGIRGSTLDTLSVAALSALNPERQRNILRRWIHSLDLPLPTTAHMERVMGDVLSAQWDRTPLVRWPGAELRRYRDRLYAMPSLPPHEADVILPWTMSESLTMPVGELTAAQTTGRGLKISACASRRVEIRFRRGGERCRLPGRRHSCSLKNLVQQRGVPPWFRQRLPLVYVDGALAAVADLWVCEPFAAAEGESGWMISWRGQFADALRSALRSSA